MAEIWKQIVGFEGYYEVSNEGSIRSVPRDILRNDGVVQHRSGRVKTQTPNKDGYLTVHLSKDGLDSRLAVHSLVARAFVDGWFDGAEVNHKDFDRKNNKATNLEWISHSDNVKYTIAAGHHICNTDLHGRNNPNYGNHSLSDKYKDDPVLSKEKQGRCGCKNGMAKSVVLLDDNGLQHKFGTIKDCANYIVSVRNINANAEWVSVKVSKAMKVGSECYGFVVRSN